MTRLTAIALFAVAAAGCTPTSMFVIPGDAPKLPEAAKPADKGEVRYRPPVQVSQLTAENAKAKAANLNDELDRDLMELVESRDAKK
jgi:hypothetical protein